MPKYRIVSREDAKGTKYFAQHKFLWFWVDFHCYSSSGCEKWPEGFETPSRTLRLVENYLESLIETETVLMGSSSKQRVVKIYD